MALTMNLMTRRKLQPSTENGFAQRLVKIRKSRDITQTDLAEATKLTQRMISHYETGDGYPPAPAIVALAKALKVTTDELLGAKPLKNVKPDRVSPEMQRLWKKFQQIAKWPEKDQRAVIRIINTMTKTTT